MRPRLNATATSDTEARQADDSNSHLASAKTMWRPEGWGGAGEGSEAKAPSNRLWSSSSLRHRCSLSLLGSPVKSGMEGRLHGAFGTLHCYGDLGHTQLGDVAEHQHFPLPGDTDAKSLTTAIWSSISTSRLSGLRSTLGQ